MAGYVHHLVVLEYANEQGDLVLPLITNGYPSIVFQSAPGFIAGQKIGNLAVYGQNMTPFPLAIKEGFMLIACFLHPYMLQPLFGVRADELTDRCIDLDLLWPLSRAFQEQLLNAVDLDQRLLLMERLVLSGPERQPDDKAAFAVRGIRQGSCGIIELQRRLNLSERALQRLFESRVGVSPRMYGRICQFDAAFQQLSNGDYTRLSDIAYQHGYADQSHFIRAFREFTGLTPQEYLEKAAPYME